MATKVKGITIELSADASGLETALKNANKALSQTQRELTSVNKSLKLNPGNVDLLAQKQRLLAKSVEQTTSKLEALKKAQASIDTSSDSGQSQYDALTREISDTQQKLVGLNNEQKSLNAEMGRAQASTSSFASGLNAVGTAASLVAEKTRAMSMAAAGALGALAALGLSGAKQADDLATLSQQLGVSTDTLQRWKYAAAGTDVDFSTMTGAVKQMKKHLDDTSGVWDRIGVKVKDASGNYRAIEDIFNDSVQALSRIDNETQRDIESMAIFGRSADELAGILDDGGAKMRQMGDEADRLGLIMPEENVQALADINEQLDIMKAQISAALVDLALPIMQALTPIIMVVAEGVRKLASILASIDPTLMSVLMVVLLLIAAISPVAGIISKICSTITLLSAVAPQAAAALASISAAAAPLLPYVALFAAIAAAIAGVVYAASGLVSTWNDLRSSTDSAFGAITKAVSTGRGELFGFAGTVMNAFSPVAGMLLTIAGGVVSGVDIIKDAISDISNIFTSFQQKAAKLGASIINAFASGIKSAINEVISAIQSLINTMSNLWGSAEKDASNAGRRTANAYIQSYNSSSSMARLTAPTVSPNTVTGASINTLNSSGPLTAAINTLASNVSGASASPTNITVELVGSAKNIFDTVRVQNNVLATATGYHALA